jgi:integrase
MEDYLGARDINHKPVRVAVSNLMQVAGNKDLLEYTRAEARELVDTLTERGNKSATVRRRLQSLHAIFEYGYHELEADKRNPFARLTIAQEGQDATRRGVFTDEQLKAVYEASVASGMDTRLIFPILGETGARLAEIVGLRWEDVCLTDNLIRIIPHAARRLKTRNSEREVPLVGYAQEAMKTLNDRRMDETYVFPRWLKPGGFVATHASNTLNKYLARRHPGLTCHCFRHTMRDRLRNADTPLELIDNIGGWASVGGMGSRYGHGFSLEQKKRFLELVKV